MKIINGKYNNARIHTDELEDTVIEQIQNMCDLEELQDAKIEIMPDCHAGKGCVIGTTIRQKINRPINPAYVGVDLGCGVMAYEFAVHDEIDEEKMFKAIDETIKKSIPVGTNVRKESWLSKKYFDSLLCKDYLSEDIITRARKSLGTLGGGNHYIEVDKLSNGNYLLVVHSGSRNLGKCVAEYYMSLANENGFIEDSLNIMKYLMDASFCAKYAFDNRKFILDILEHGIRKEFDDFEFIDAYGSVHNTIEVKGNGDIIIRKGSVSAEVGEKILIPINMKDGLVIAIGKGNEETNLSAPHGAGRVMGRNQAKKSLSIEKFKEQMKNIHSICVSSETLDEAPDAYKPIDSILENISKMVTIKEVAKPIYNFKA